MVISSILNYFSNILSYPDVSAATCGKKFKLFVYGTLKRGEPNHEHLSTARNGTATFLGEAKTKKRFPLILVTKYHMPCLLNLPGRGCLVEGEVYEVNTPMLGSLDKLISPNIYVREQIDIALKTGDGKQETVKCYVFFLNTVTEDLANRRNLGKYTCKGKHGLPYIPNTDATIEDLEDVLKY